MLLLLLGIYATDLTGENSIIDFATVLQPNPPHEILEFELSKVMHTCFLIFFRHFVSVHLHVVCITMYMYVTLSFYHDVCFTWIKRSLKITMTLEKIFHKKLCFCVVSDTMTFWELILALLQSSWIYFCNVLFRYYWPS